MIPPVDYAPFDGDGRKSLGPYDVRMPNTLPTSVTGGQARMLIDSFLRTGHSTHSSAGATLWVILAWCQHQKQPYVLRASPGEGYYVEKAAKYQG